jgi:DNA-binding response OmpR family regulator
VAVDQHEQYNNCKLIAVVEDDANLAVMFRDMLDMLKEHGYWRLRVFSDGQDAIDHLPNLGAHLILLDVGLPNLDGISLYKMLRGHSNTKNTPIIVITGSQDWELHRKGLQTGILLRKPFSMEQLLFMIHALLPDDEETN